MKKFKKMTTVLLGMMAAGSIINPRICQRIPDFD